VQALQQHMPKFLPLWKHLCHITQADELESRLLSFYCPTPYKSGCSQAVWSKSNPILIRNYDYKPELCEGRIIKTKWHDTEVIGCTDSLWGILDGMNEHGLSVSLSFGGKEGEQEGFGLPLVLRYILEFCKTTSEAVEMLCQIPVNMSYNITFLDAAFDIRTIELSPSEDPVITRKPLAVNHQSDMEATSYSMFSRSYEREQGIIRQLYEPLMNIDAFIDFFSYPPLFASDYQKGFGTLYTAIYNPTLKAMEYRWPHHIKRYQSFQLFEEQEFWVNY
jgi:predicted choloylglycine hydrolase